MQTVDAVEGTTKPLSAPAKQGRLPHVLVEAGDNKAVGSPATSTVTECPMKETLSFLEDDTSLNETPSGGGTLFPSHLQATPTMTKVRSMPYQKDEAPCLRPVQPHPKDEINVLWS